MPRESYDRELQRLQDEMLALGSMVEDALVGSVETLKQRDFEASQKLIDQDKQINEKRFAIETDALVLLATQQPMASDLRTIAAVLEIVTELERMGDYAKGIAKINLMIGDDPLIKPLIDLPKMADRTSSMLHRALDAFVRRDVDLALEIPLDDDEVDEYYNLIYRELMDFIVADPNNTEQANHLLWAAHNLERTADRVINICERVVFTVTGKMVELDKLEGESLTLESII
jgi:phosphate transport system protein